jgi:pimeloyl-ACP methyl ester carboxylesterase
MASAPYTQPMSVLYAHGLEGRPDGAKARAMREAGLEVVAPDGRRKGLADRISALLHASAEGDGWLLVGSSYGGLAAAWLATHHPDRFRGVVLCAPALHYAEPPVVSPSELVVPGTLPCTVLHGVGDPVVPISASRALVARCPHVRLLELDDDHRLSGSLPLLVASVLAQR